MAPSAPPRQPPSRAVSAASLARSSGGEVDAAGAMCADLGANTAFGALVSFWETTRENTAAVLGLDNERDMVDAEEASAAHHRATHVEATPPPRAPSSLRRRRGDDLARSSSSSLREAKREAKAAKAAAEAIAEAPAEACSPEPALTARSTPSSSVVAGATRDPRASERDDDSAPSMIPGLDYLRRFYAPRKLLREYETMETIVKSREFRKMAPAKQEEIMSDLLALKERIEQRENRLNHLSSLGGSLHGAYVGVMASMLSIFVAQTCEGATNAFGEHVAGSHVCTYSEAATRGGRYHDFVLAFNVFTLFAVVVTEIQILRREKWLDDALSYDPDESANHLLSEPDEVPNRSPVLREHPFIAHALLWQNLVVGNLARAAIIAVCINLVVSAVLVLGMHPAGTSSAVGMVTNTVLLGSKLMHAASVCLQKRNAFRAVSIYKATRVVFNVIDTSYLASPQYKRIAAEGRYEWEAVEAEMNFAAAAEHGDRDALRKQARGVLAHMAVGTRGTLRLGRISTPGANDADELSRKGGHFGGDSANGDTTPAEVDVDLSPVPAPEYSLEDSPSSKLPGAPGTPESKEEKLPDI